jgi:transaldolase
MSDPVTRLTEARVSIWLDDLSRERLVGGDLARLVRDRHVAGVTTNPTIFAKAISGRDAYAEQIQQSALRRVGADQALRELTAFDVRWAADVLRPVFEAPDGVDGRVSIRSISTQRSSGRKATRGSSCTNRRLASSVPS